MIVPMKKVFLVVLDKDRKESLKKLRRAGIMHLETLEGKGTDLVARKSEYSKLQTAVLQLSEIKVPKKSKKDLSSVEVKISNEQIPQMIDFADTVSALFETKRKYEIGIMENKAELERIERWGDVSREDILYLAEKNIHLSLYEIPSAKYNVLPDDIYTVFVNEDKSIVRVLLVTETGEKPSDMPAEAFEVTLPEKSSLQMKNEIKSFEEKIESINKELLEATKKIPLLKQAQKYVNKQVEFENVFSGMECDSEGEYALSWVTGYVPTNEVPKISKLAETEKWAFAADDPSEDDMVPTKLKNNKFVSLIYPVTDFLGTVPGYNEYDISGWFLLFFAVFFGMIFGDAGYGLLLVIAAIIGIFTAIGKHKKPGSMMYLLLLLGITTMLWGAATCNWFGIPVHMLPDFVKIIDVDALSAATSVTSTEMETWVSQNLQVFCFVLALLQLTVAHLKGIRRYIKSLKWLGELGSLGMLWGLFFIVLNMVVSADRFPLPSFVIPLIGGGFLLNFIFSNYSGNIGKSILESCKNIVSVLLGVVNVFSDIVSYIRLWAVGLAGSAISATVNDMAGPMLGGAIIFAGILILCFGHGLNMILNVLSVIVHGVRLNTLEFSNHLGMSWSGFVYEPFSESVEK